VDRRRSIIKLPYEKTKYICKLTPLLKSQKLVMKNQFDVAHSDRPVARIALHKLVDNIITDLLPAAVSRKSFIINDVPPEVISCTNENLLSLVLTTLLTQAVNATKSLCIHIGAALTGDCTIIKVKDNTGYFYKTISHVVKQERFMAEKIGGCISINQENNGVILTTFSFHNQLNAA
jgi:hypothetical protein